MAHYRLEVMVIAPMPHGEKRDRKGGSMRREIQVGIDVGWEKHEVEILHPDGRYERMSLTLDFDSFNRLLERMEELKRDEGSEIVVGIEGSNGHASPLDEYLMSRGYTVYNISSTHLDKLRSLYGAEFKDDEYDAKLMCVYLKNRKWMMLEDKAALVEAVPKKECEEKIKVLSRTVSGLLKEQARMGSQLISCLKSYFPEMVQMQKYLDRRWLLLVLKEFPKPSQLRKQTVESLREIRDPRGGKRIREIHATKLIALAKKVSYISIAEEEKGQYVSYLAEELLRKIEVLAEVGKKIEEIGKRSESYQAIDQFVGAGPKVTSRLVGEIGNIVRFKAEGSLAAYLGVCSLKKESGKCSRDKKNTNVNRRAKNAMLELAYQSTKFSDESRRYYEKKRSEGKTHLHALRCLARHLSRDIYKALSKKTAAEIPVATQVA